MRSASRPRTRLLAAATACHAILHRRHSIWQQPAAHQHLPGAWRLVPVFALK